MNPVNTVHVVWVIVWISGTCKPVVLHISTTYNNIIRRTVTVRIKIRENNTDIGGTVVFLPFGGAVVYHGGFVVIGGYVRYVVGGAWVPFPAKITQGNLYMIITTLTQFYNTA